jgi:hypothetical protein
MVINVLSSIRMVILSITVVRTWLLLLTRRIPVRVVRKVIGLVKLRVVESLDHQERRGKGNGYRRIRST